MKNIMRPFSLDSDDSCEKAPRIDDLLSSQKKKPRRSEIAEYKVDAVCLLASRLEIHILKRFRSGFYAIDNMAKQMKD